MLRYIMAKGHSGRIVIDVDPAFKDEVYLALAAQKSTLKDWFLRQAQQLCIEQREPLLLRLQETPPPYNHTSGTKGGAQ